MTRAKSQTAYELIKQKIFDGVYPPLSDISEEILQQELGIGRTPIHEALQRLGDEGFVNIYPRKGTIVRPPAGAVAEADAEGVSVPEGQQ